MLGNPLCQQHNTQPVTYTNTNEWGAKSKSQLWDKYIFNTVAVQHVASYNCYMMSNDKINYCKGDITTSKQRYFNDTPNSMWHMYVTCMQNRAFCLNYNKRRCYVMICYVIMLHHKSTHSEEILPASSNKRYSGQHKDAERDSDPSRTGKNECGTGWRQVFCDLRSTGSDINTQVKSSHRKPQSIKTDIVLFPQQ